MGEVYKAHDPKLARDVAIKVLPRSLATPELLERFEREARAVAALSHPNILAIHDFAKNGPLAYTVTELLEGETLRRRLEMTSLPPRKAVDVTMQICRGLGAAHGRGIIHRDLKPENVFLTREGLVKILDFGLAKVQSPLPAELNEDEDDAPTKGRGTASGVILGTVGYMSPEQVRGQQADARSDIFSLGTILYEMLTGERAFSGESSADTLSAILKEDPPPPVAVPPPLERIVFRCLDKDPEERFQSARDLRFALEALSDVSDADPSRPRAPATNSIAVLPFRDLSPEKDQDYFCEGMAEEISNALAPVPGLRVAAGSSASPGGGDAHDVRTLGKALGVSHLLEGSVRSAGKRLRVTTRLVSVRDGYQVWSERFDREMEDVLTVQDEIASSIVGALRLELAVSEGESTKRHSTDLEAYRLYLKGRQSFERRLRGGPHKAVEYYEQAVAIDPSYALAHAGRGDCYTLLSVYGAIPPRDAHHAIETAVATALSVDPDLAEAHTTRARFLWVFDGSLEEAEREFLRALELNPSEVQAWEWYAHLLATTGRLDEAVAKARMAAEIDPLSPYAHAQEGIAKLFYDGFYGGQTSDAVEVLERAAAMDPDNTVARYTLGLAYGRTHQHDRAIEALSRVVELTGRATYYLAVLAWAYGNGGLADEARTLLEEIQQRAGKEYVGPMIFAFIHAGLREVDAAMEWLSHAERERSPIRVWLGLPLYDNLRADLRFEALVDRLWRRQATSSSD